MPVVSYKCPSCGAPLSFNADKQNFSCDYCLSEFTEEQVIEYNKKLDEDLKTTPADKENPQEDKSAQGDGSKEFEQNASLYICPSCGAEIITDADTAATECFYCHNAVVLGGRLSGELKPDKVVPFAISKDKAVETFKNKFGRKKFLPKNFFNQKQIERLSGIYFPYWYVNSSDTVDMTAKTKKVRTWDVGDDRYTETSIYRCTRRADIDINNLFRAAIKNEDALMLKYVHPYNLASARDFSMAYLSGFKADKRNIEAVELRQDVKTEIFQIEKRMVEATVEGVITKTEAYNTENKLEQWNYTLLPVWIMSYRHNGKNYIYGMNGQTGKIYGRLPVSLLKLLALFGGVMAAAVILMLLLIILWSI